MACVVYKKCENLPNWVDFHPLFLASQGKQLPSSWLTSSVRTGQYLYIWSICIQSTSNTVIRQAGIGLRLNSNYINDY